MMPRRVASIRDVVKWDLCTGCGSCAYACPSGKITMVDIPSRGIRPRIDDDGYDGSDLLAICPGAGVTAPVASAPDRNTKSAVDLGPTIEMWIGHAVDP